MKRLSRSTILCSILKFYEAGYITTAEKDELVAHFYKSTHSAEKAFCISTNADGRELYLLHTLKPSTIMLVKCYK